MIPWGMLIKYSLYFLAPIVVCLGIYWFGVQDGEANVQQKWDKEKATQVAAALEESEKARQTEATLRKKLEESERARQTESERNRRIAAGLRAESARLRDDIAAYAAGNSNSDTLAAARSRAIALGNALEEALRSSAICAEDAESINADLRAVLKAWPVITNKETQ